MRLSSGIPIVGSDLPFSVGNMQSGDLLEMSREMSFENGGTAKEILLRNEGSSYIPLTLFQSLDQTSETKPTLDFSIM